MSLIIPSKFTIFYQRYHRPILLVFMVILIVWRSPLLFLSPRLWAEEATLYLYHGWCSGVWDTIAFVPKMTAGYLNLAANIPSLFIQLIDIKYAPYITTYFSLAVFMYAFYLVLWDETGIGKGPIMYKFLTCISFLFFATAASSGEIWLNTINLQTICGLISFLILFSEKPSKLAYGMLAFCSLSGPYTAFIGIAYFLVFLLKRNRTEFYKLAVVSVCTGIQLGIYLYLKMGGLLSPKKTAPFDTWGIPLNTLRYHIAQPIFGMNQSGDFLKMVGFTYSKTLLNNPAYLHLAGFASLLLIAISIYFVLKRKEARSPYVLILILCFLITSVLTSLFSVGNAPGGRYSYIPSIILGTTFLYLIYNVQGTWLLIKILFVSSIYYGIKEYRTYHSERLLGVNNSQANWREEVDKWKSDSHYMVKLWPQNWKMHLERKEDLQDFRNSVASIPAFRLTSVENQWIGETFPLKGSLSKVALVIKWQFENIQDDDEIHIRLLQKDTHDNFYWASVKGAEFKSTKEFIAGIRNFRLVGKPSYYQVEALEIRIKSKHAGSIVDVSSVHYISPL